MDDQKFQEVVCDFDSTEPGLLGRAINYVETKLIMHQLITGELPGRFTPRKLLLAYLKENHDRPETMKLIDRLETL